jgi:GNAT superfamily N-acetyltransferase
MSADAAGDCVIDFPPFLRAYEATVRACCVAVAQAAGGHVVDQGDALLVAMPFDYSSNSVFDVRYAGTEAERRTKEILSQFRAWRSGVRFRIGLSGNPALKAILRRPLFNRVRIPVMAGYLDRISRRAPSDARTRVWAVDDYRVFEHMPHPLYGLTQTTERKKLLAVFQALAEEKPRLHWTFVTEEAGDLVASVVLFLHDGTVGGQGMVVRKDRRRLGIGASLLSEASAVLVKHGATQAAFASSVMGGRFYPTLGFHEVGKCLFYHCSWERLRKTP